jgi:hypothetical protein
VVESDASLRKTPSPDPRSRIDDVGLVPIGKLTSLKMLNLTDIGVSDDGLKRLAGLKNLTELRLERTLATESGIAVLKISLPDTNVIH